MKNNLLIIFITVLILGACAPQPTPTPISSENLDPTSLPAPTATPQPRGLTVCLGREPNSLYIYGNPNSAARSVLSAIYDGPMDIVTYSYQPVILERRPSFTNGDAIIAGVDVKRGDMIVDVDGILRPLDNGVRMHPSGCTGADCAVEYEGGSIKMDQMVVTFTLLPDLTWSDGTPLTAYDSVYSFQVAAYSDTPGSKYFIDRTDIYEAVDDQSVTWWGVPGFIYQDYASTFWTPLPKHLLEQYSPAELTQANETTKSPLGWGPYIIKEWVPGERIALTRNPAYFRAKEGLPYFDFVTYRVVSDIDSAIDGLSDGTCDILDPSLSPETQTGKLLELQSIGKAQVLSVPTDVMERIDLGITPVGYDNGYTPGIVGDRADFFGDPRTRQALAMCMDRQQVIDTVLYGLTSIPSSYVPQTHPLYFPLSRQYQFDVEAGKSLLDTVGWVDADNDPTTPRVSLNIPGIPNQTPLVLNYWTTNAEQRKQASDIIATSLQQCGVQVNLEYYSATDFYAEGPAGPLFGRQFDMAQYAMSVPAGLQPPCDWFTTAQIPDASINWLGVNVSGYSNPEYDGFCQSAMSAFPDSEKYYQNYEDAQATFADDLPSIPLYWRVKVIAARTGLCNLSLDPSASFLWDIESIRDDGCPDN